MGYTPFEGLELSAWGGCHVAAWAGEHSERQRLKSLAAAKQRTPHFLMKEAIQRYIEDEEAEQAAIQAAAASGVV